MILRQYEVTFMLRLTVREIVSLMEDPIVLGPVSFLRKRVWADDIYRAEWIARKLAEREGWTLSDGWSAERVSDSMRCFNPECRYFGPVSSSRVNFHSREPYS